MCRLKYWKTITYGNKKQYDVKPCLKYAKVTGRCMCVALSIEKTLHIVMKDHYVKPYLKYAKVLKYHVLLPSNTRMKITLTFHVLDLHQLNHD